MYLTFLGRLDGHFPRLEPASVELLGLKSAHSTAGDKWPPHVPGAWISLYLTTLAMYKSHTIRFWAVSWDFWDSSSLGT